MSACANHHLRASRLAGQFLRADRLKTIFIGTGPDAELEANKAVSQRFIRSTDDEKDKRLMELLYGRAQRLPSAAARTRAPTNTLLL